MTPAAKLLKPEEVAERLGIAARTIRKWASERQVPCVRLGKLYRFTEDDVARIIDGNRQRPLRQVARAA